MRLGHLHSHEWDDSKLVDCLIGIKLLISDRNNVLMCCAIEFNSIAHHHKHSKKTKLSFPPSDPERSNGTSSLYSSHKRPPRSIPGPCLSASSSAGAHDNHDSLLSIDVLLASTRQVNELTFLP